MGSSERDTLESSGAERLVKGDGSVVDFDGETI